MRISFTKGTCYTRGEISKALGGGTHDFLPHNNKSVVCGCFRKDLNPNAPYEVLPGKGVNVRRWADHLGTAQKNQAIPIFIKKAAKQWEFVGPWRCVNKINVLRDIRRREKQTGRKLSMILEFQEAPHRKRAQRGPSRFQRIPLKQ